MKKMIKWFKRGGLQVRSRERGGREGRGPGRGGRVKGRYSGERLEFDRHARCNCTEIIVVCRRSETIEGRAEK